MEIQNRYCSRDFYAVRKDPSQNGGTAPLFVGRALGSTCAERMGDDFAGATVCRIVCVFHVLDESGSRFVQEHCLPSLGSAAMVLASVCLDLPTSTDVTSSLVGTAVTHPLHRNPCACRNARLLGGKGQPRASISAFDPSDCSALPGTLFAQPRAYPSRSNLDTAPTETQEASVVSRCA